MISTAQIEAYLSRSEGTPVRLQNLIQHETGDVFRFTCNMSIDGALQPDATLWIKGEKWVIVEGQYDINPFSHMLARS